MWECLREYFFCLPYLPISTALHLQLTLSQLVSIILLRALIPSEYDWLLCEWLKNFSGFLKCLLLWVFRKYSLDLLQIYFATSPPFFVYVTALFILWRVDLIFSDWNDFVRRGELSRTGVERRTVRDVPAGCVKIVICILYFYSFVLKDVLLLFVLFLLSRTVFRYEILYSTFCHSVC